MSQQHAVEVLERLRRQVDTALELVKRGPIFDCRAGEYGLVEGEMLVGDFVVREHRVEAGNWCADRPHTAG